MLYVITISRCAVAERRSAAHGASAWTPAEQCHMNAPLMLLLVAVAGASLPVSASAQAQHPDGHAGPAGFMDAMGGAQRALAGSDHHQVRRLLRTAHHRAPDDGRPHMFNDLAVTADGGVHVTDSEEGALYRLRSGGSAVERVYGDDVNFTYPNGIALSPDGGRLFVAHIEGISRFELDAPRPAMVRMPAPAGVPTTGIDGLYACGQGVLGVQNRMGFQQVTYFTLDASGRRITGARALERRHPAHDSATTGAVVGDEFHYIANAQLRRLGPDWRVAPDDRAALPLILRLPLDGACG
jgi:streptogramin lyase